MAATVATPLERALGRIAGVTEMTSSSSLGSTSITLQFDLSRNIDGAARDVQAAINAARSAAADQPAEQPDVSQGESGRCADHDPVADVGDHDARPDVRCCLHASSRRSCRRCEGIGQVTVGGSSLPAVRVELNPVRTSQIRHRHRRTCATRLRQRMRTGPRAWWRTATRHWQIYANDQAKEAAEYLPLIVAYRNGAPVHLSDVAEVIGFGPGLAQRRDRPTASPPCSSS